MAEQLSRRNSEASEHSVNCDVEADVAPPSSKRVKIQWQETLISLVAAQQQQLAELSRQSKMAAMPSPTPSVSGVDGPSTQASSFGNAQVSFRLTSYDPDKSAYSVEEWLEDATKLKDELKISDNLMIVKASEALKNRGYQYCCEWRPLNRTWEQFCADLSVAFPDKETPGSRAYKAATLRSHNCESLCEYGNQKLRSISRFQDNLPWAKVLSMVEYGLDHAEARSALQIQKPDSERELLKLLSGFDARRVGSSRMPRHSELVGMSRRWRPEHQYKERRDDKFVSPNNIFKGVCFKCGRQGHQQHACRNLRKEESFKETTLEKPEQADIPSCTHCKKMGHTETNCWFKHGKPKKAFVIKK